MKSLTSRQFREGYALLPEPIKAQARRAHSLFLQDASHPGLNFKKVDDENDIYSARIGLGYRALGHLNGDTVVWFWIGTHSEYNRLA